MSDGKQPIWASIGGTEVFLAFGNSNDIIYFLTEFPKNTSVYFGDEPSEKTPRISDIGTIRIKGGKDWGEGTRSLAIQLNRNSLGSDELHVYEWVPKSPPITPEMAKIIQAAFA